MQMYSGNQTPVRSPDRITFYNILNQIAVIHRFIRVAELWFSDPELHEYIKRINVATKTIPSVTGFIQVFRCPVLMNHHGAPGYCLS